MLNVRLAGDHLYGKLLFTWQSLVMSMTACFVLSFFPRGILDEILNLIESVSEGFPSYFWFSLQGLFVVKEFRMSTFLKVPSKLLVWANILQAAWVTSLCEKLNSLLSGHK